MDTIKYPSQGESIEDKSIASARKTLQEGRKKNDDWRRKKRRVRCKSCGEKFWKNELNIFGLCENCAGTGCPATEKLVPQEHGSIISIDIAVPVHQPRRCFCCDSSLFFFLGDGIIQCSQCHTEYSVIKGRK